MAQLMRDQAADNASAQTQHDSNLAGAIWISQTSKGEQLLRILLDGDFFSGFLTKEDTKINAPDFRIVKYDDAGNPEEIGAAWFGQMQHASYQKLYMEMNDGTYYTAVPRSIQLGSSAHFSIFSSTKEGGKTNDNN